MTKLTRLKINKFRNVEPVELRFSGGLNVLLGINGSGKTTFLELIAALLSENLTSLSEEEFSIEYSLDFGTTVVDVHVKNARNSGYEPPRNRRFPTSPPEHELEFAVRLDNATTEASHFIESNQSSTTVNSRDRRTNTTTSKSLPSLINSSYQYLLSKSIEWNLLDDSMGSSWWSVVQLGSLSRFDEALGFFHSILREDAWINLYTAKVDSGNYEFRFAHRRAAVSMDLQRSLHKAISDKWLQWRGSEILSLATSDQLKFLQRMVDIAAFRDAKLELRYLGRTPNDLPVDERQIDLKFGMLRFWFEKLDGTTLPEQKLSYGQKRLLSFLYYLDCNPDIVIADELAAGLHHAWITACLEAIGDRQAFLASHDPLLIDEIDLSSIEDVERSFILCRCDTSSGKERLHWSNMSRYDAERFFEAYNVGLQHVSEILRTKRLW
jgi:energy-coupling factor transporter ATP-binding protein EcfA2